MPSAYWVAKAGDRIVLYRNIHFIYSFRRNLFDNDEILANIIGLFAQAHDLGFHAGLNAREVS